MTMYPEAPTYDESSRESASRASPPPPPPPGAHPTQMPRLSAESSHYSVQSVYQMPRQIVLKMEPSPLVRVVMNEPSNSKETAHSVIVSFAENPAKNVVQDKKTEPVKPVPSPSNSFGRFCMFALGFLIAYFLFMRDKLNTSFLRGSK